MKDSYICLNPIMPKYGYHFSYCSILLLYIIPNYITFDRFPFFQIISSNENKKFANIMKKIQLIFLFSNLLLFCIICGGSVFIFILLKNSDKENAQRNLNTLCNSKKEATRSQLLGGATVLSALALSTNDSDADGVNRVNRTVSDEFFNFATDDLILKGNWQISSISKSRYFPMEEEARAWAAERGIIIRPIETGFTQRTTDFLIIENTYPIGSGFVGINYISEKNRHITVLESILERNITISEPTVPIAGGKGILIFQPLFHGNGQFYGGISGFYRGPIIIQNRQDTSDVFYRIIVDDKLLLKDPEFKKANVKSFTSFPFFNRIITFECSRNHSAMVTPWILLIIGILIAFLIPAIIGIYTMQFARIKRETEMRIAAEKAASDSLVMRNTADESSKLKTMFLANMSHEIRTPLNGIKGNVEFLMDTKLSDEQEEYVKTLSESTGLLMSIVNDILDFSKVESGKMTKEEIPTNVAAIFSEIKRVYSSGTVSNNNQISTDISFDKDAYILTDPSRLRQIMTNLISNSVKFTKNGNIVLKSFIQDGKIYFQVSDNGIGMSESQINKLFTPFQQADATTTRKYGGTGLGLSICKKLSNLLNGDIYAESEQGKGSTFTVWIPFVQTETPQNPKYSKIRTLKNDNVGQNYNILIVDDNRINLVVAEKMISKLGYKTKTVSDGQQAVNEVTENPKKYDAILMDISMPVMDGYTATNTLRNMGVTIPIVAMTANVMEGEKERCLSYGMNEYIPKPLYQNVVKDIIGNLLQVGK